MKHRLHYVQQNGLLCFKIIIKLCLLHHICPILSMALDWATAHSLGTTGPKLCCKISLKWNSGSWGQSLQTSSKPRVWQQATWCLQCPLVAASPSCVLWVVCVAGGGDRGLSAVPGIRTRVPYHQRNPQHAAEWRRGVEGIKQPNYHAQGIVGIQREERLDSGSSWCHEKIGSTVWLIVVMMFQRRVLPVEEKD